MSQPKPKILLYTDCDFFAGCEKPLENISSNKQITDKYDVVYAFRNSKIYSKDLANKKLIARIMPFNIITPGFFLNNFNKKNTKAYLLTKILVRVVEKLQVFNVIYFISQCFLLFRERPDIVHINNGGYPGADSCRIMAITSGLFSIKKIVFTINNMAVPRNHFLDKIIDKRVNKNVDSFVTASSAAARELIKVRGIGEGKIQAIPNAVLFDNIITNDQINFRKEFAIPHDTFVIGSAGLLIERKGYDVLIKAANLLPRTKNWQIYIFGEGDQRELLEKMISKYNLQEYIFLPGFKNNIHAYVSSLDIFVLPTVGTEDMPNAINEAMLMSKPIVASATSGIPEQIDDGYNGYLVPPSDFNDLASRIESLIQLDNYSLTKMGLNSNNKYMTSFSYNIAMQKYLSIYDS
jgi:glycosyltransferase involved in cell wall biosynthesis